MLVTDDHWGAMRVAMCEAARTYDPAKGASFATHATYWLRAALHNMYIQSAAGGLKAYTTNAERQYLWGHKEDHGLSPERCAALDRIKFGTSHVALDADDCTLELPGSCESPEVQLHAARTVFNRKLAISAALRQLDPRERKIIKWRLLQDEELTLAEIGYKLCLSRERVRQLETRALKKLRGIMEDDRD